MTIGRIIYPIDFTKPSMDHLKDANYMAKTHGAKLLLLHVVEYIIHKSHYAIVDQSQEDILKTIIEKQETKLKEIAVTLTDVDTEILVLHGSPVERILETCLTENVDLIIMPTHGHSSVLHSLIGSVTEKVVRKARCPVLSIKPAEGN